MSLLACGSWQRVGAGADVAPDAGRLVPPLFDAGSVYAEMGLLTAGEPMPFVGGVRFLAGASADSTMALVGISLTNDMLAFRRSGDTFEARYRVEVAFRRDGETLAFARTDEVVRVRDFPETRRGDESVIFQQFLHVPPGHAQVSIAVRDRNATSLVQVSGSLTVPTFTGEPRLSSVIPVYEVVARENRSATPNLVLNPKATVPYGIDTLTLYFEVVGAPPTDAVIVRGVSRDQGEAWQDTVTLDRSRSFQAVVVGVAPGRRPIGVVSVEATFLDGADTVRTSTLSSFSDQWVVGNFGETLSLLRYFATETALRTLRDAPVEERAELWREFWEATDPDPLTPGHEAFDLYFQRVQEANDRFQETGVAGWLSDRGEVFVTIGPPDEIFDSSSDLQGAGRYFRWHYISERLTVDFVDDTGFGRFRLTDASRAEFMQVVNRYRRGG
jgi:GWxTD domain-containing protein